MTQAAVVTPEQHDEVSYRRAKTWQIALSQMSSGMTMTFYVLVGLLSYVANENYGIALGLAGLILTASRVLDGFLNPILALVMDRVNTKHGKIRLFMIAGWTIRSIAALLLFVWSSGGGVILFVALYLIYIVGNVSCDIASIMIQPVITNDPRQRPVVGVWSTAYSYVVPLLLTVVSNVIILPMFGNRYTSEMLAAVALFYVPLSFVFLALSCIAIKDVDVPENFEGFSAAGEKVRPRDMWHLIKDNRPFQMYIIHCVSAKLSQQTMSQAIVGTVVFGILVGNIQLSTIVSGISSLPQIIFAIIAARYCGKLGSRRVAIASMVVGIILSVAAIAYCSVIDMRLISTSTIPMVIFFALLLFLGAAKMCVTTADTAMRSDVVDYELIRSGKYLPGVVTATYNFIDQFVSSLGITIAAFGVSMVGFAAAAPQPTDAPTPEIKVMGLFLYFVIPALAWVIGLISMKCYHLTREKMVEIQVNIADKKAELAQNPSKQPL
ncbi:major facilitator superfamily MFS_1 [Coriobacterium glomerans PW2]|uniref:Major facilitator superfamily MFS_1 n=1 Tax=Coriobacterium glomerans (strain ATCC 49209 / DSM 20642 / JCM 10262 / PW2) TaxID=700015 RepID=F2NA41_CORGP|nr:MFS transporter [Coriobacterium glomerans]AEB06435.1 major facilitator superfamily MFS_1 [Coriobacterium glomerans PW2]